MSCCTHSRAWLLRVMHKFGPDVLIDVVGAVIVNELDHAAVLQRSQLCICEELIRPDAVHDKTLKVLADKLQAGLCHLNFALMQILDRSPASLADARSNHVRCTLPAQLLQLKHVHDAVPRARFSANMVLPHTRGALTRR